MRHAAHIRKRSDGRRNKVEGLTDSARSRPSPITAGVTLPVGGGIGRGGAAFAHATRDHPIAGYEALKHPALGSGTRIKLRLHARTASPATGRLAAAGFETGVDGEYTPGEPEHPESAAAKSRLPKPKPHVIAILSRRGIFICLFPYITLLAWTIANARWLNKPPVIGQ